MEIRKHLEIMEKEFKNGIYNESMKERPNMNIVLSDLIKECELILDFKDRKRNTFC